MLTGGIIGNLSSSVVTESINEGEIIGKCQTGGITGQTITIENSKISEVNKCTNSGNIETTGYHQVNGNIQGKVEEWNAGSTGGIVGFAYPRKNNKMC